MTVARGLATFAAVYVVGAAAITGVVAAAIGHFDGRDVFRLNLEGRPRG